MTHPAVLPPEAVERLSGLDQLRGIVDGTFAGPSMGATLGFRLIHIEEGFARFAAEPGANAMNPLGTIHGGWAATVLDSALGCAVHSTLAPGERFQTLEFKVNLTRPLTPGMAPLTAEGRLLSRGRRTATSEATLSGADGKLYAFGTTTCLIT